MRGGGGAGGGGMQGVVFVGTRLQRVLYLMDVEQVRSRVFGWLVFFF